MPINDFLLVQLIPCFLQTCGSGFKTKARLDGHMASHSDERPFLCDQCDGTFKHASQLSRHFKRNHTPGYIVPTPHKCPHCDKAFQTRVRRDTHALVHTGERPFGCDLCGRRYFAKKSLHDHLKTHTSRGL